MRAKQLIIAQKIKPFNAILKAMSIKKAYSFRSAWHCSKYQVFFSLLISVTSFFLTFTFGNWLYSFCTMPLALLNISCLKNQTPLFCLKYIFKVPSNLHSKGKVQEKSKKLMLAWSITTTCHSPRAAGSKLGKAAILWKILKSHEAYINSFMNLRS